MNGVLTGPKASSVLVATNSPVTCLGASCLPETFLASASASPSVDTGLPSHVADDKQMSGGSQSVASISAEANALPEEVRSLFRGFVTSRPISWISIIIGTLCSRAKTSQART